MNIRKFAAAAVLFSLPFALAACSPAEIGGDAAASASQSDVLSDAPEVDRSGDGNFPEVIGGFGEKPEIKPGSGAEPSVISVKTLHEGDGPVIGENAYVTVNYAGVLWDGTPFDSSFERGQSATFSLNGVIPGWKYGLAGQKVGDRVEIVIPSQWAYGEQGTPTIPANSTLVFVVDLLSMTDVDNLDALRGAKETGAELPKEITYEGKPAEAPSLTFAAGSAPQEPQLIVVAEGAGEKLADGQEAVVRTIGVAQGGQPASQDEWHNPTIVPVEAVEGLAGVPVGSRVLLLRPGSTPEQPAVAIIVDVAGVVAAEK